ncbi:acetyl-CoA carboxylase biotin carboxyl carrier protein [Pseudenhygromyxa sp. WMMC2535]|uniref:acetyl-CoA carboxylase biotin carboxyl carrier protein n=1 Tax=Pseudenhygromyxa sp. WMMC2535 TaxID=2712867 RepID=UPI001553E2D8|nr:acetyl-CoA carboxylase biotin carboxyl carrier protein [Pseudenhygromyxa sp. WMMC2535]NVB38270.1 acetyl-CoA carboxylase biotin carboxyl carrier protein [Pseudenhygromyxa sp. WMMC2535]
MSDNDSKLPDITYVSELAKVFKRFRLDELEIETGEQRILMRRGAEVTTYAAAPAPLAAAAPAAPAAAPAAAAPAAAAAEEPEGEFITSPFVGTFYLAPRPDAQPFVKPGETVAAGQTVCIVEAMKLFNEIEAEFGCVIEESLVGNQQPVEFGTKLFRVRRL